MFFRTPFYLLKSDSERKPRLIDIPGNLIEWPLYKNTLSVFLDPQAIKYQL